ncbi:alkyltransferase-like protein 1 [Colletotrichum spaethianum]|uniref:Alkyltransferase-like protein 1 n=1 Tax=Colletotrichum spaethianum TaxID=700344 RepID=A0AA37NZN7_9PEZI|nr:alkyltransferase-like protein 1 [Colletotrichum spaethianum]GKT44645.1 alkyltransferase-like protein 1 [Colletotrichum spaethianum]
MPRTDEAEAFFHAVYTAVQEIPFGRVTTYGHIAKLIGTRESAPPFPPPHLHLLPPSRRPSPTLHHTSDPSQAPSRASFSSCRGEVKADTGLGPNVPAERPRQVGICLKHLPTDPTSRFNNETVPWQRVINAKGTISPRSQPSGARSQAAALEAEDVEVSQAAMGEFQVDFKTYGWFPEVLPSEEANGQ